MSELSVRELTARGRGAIRVLEVTGPRALERVRSLLAGPLPEPGSFAPCRLRDGEGAVLDEALVLVHAPDRAELHLHGSPATVERVRAELRASQEVAGDPVLDLEGRAEELLASAPSEAAARLLLDQVQGALRRALTELLALPVGVRRRRAAELARDGRIALRLLTPPRIVIAGPSNAGKSTLFNVLVGRERVLVDSSAGTTRDAVLERIRLGAYAIDLFDTAGERELGRSSEHELVERAGQDLARGLREGADLTVWLVPCGGAAPADGDARLRVLGSREDERRAGNPLPSWPCLSAQREPARARAAVEELVHDALALPMEPWVAGRGVPFEPEQVLALENASDAALLERVHAWLAAGRD